MKDVLREKSYAFALRIVKLSRYLVEEKKEFVLSKQILEAGTSMGANVEEAKQGQSKPDLFISYRSRIKKPLKQTIG